METVNSAITELLDLIDRKRQLFDSIMEITLRQKIDIEGNEANNIGELVNQKQSVIDRIDEIDKSFAEKFNLLKKQLKVNTLEEVDFTKYPVLKILKFKVQEIMSLAQKIMKIEESNKEKLAQKMNELKTEMKQMSIGKKSLKAYEVPVINNDGIYIDKKK
ncbi:MAG TPA: flagellar export chaperone FlgN [Patescibacteria group bacterium]|nr:flagellar export chaperone FlgN [Patescibacteria group bacterium]